MRKLPKPRSQGEMTLTAGMVATAIGIVLFCVGMAFSFENGFATLAPETSGGIIATGILVWLKGAMMLSLEL